MKNIGIITLYHRNYNYGGALQAYALNLAVRSLGYGCQTIDYVPRSMPLAEKIRRKVASDGALGVLRASVRLGLEGAGRKIKGKAVPYLNPEAEEVVRLREENIAFFLDRYIPHTKPYTSESIRETVELFDIFLCGSDQIWNMGSAGSFDPVYWLDFVPPSRGKASYAASIPMPEIPEGEKETIRRWLRTFDLVTVREEHGRELLEPLRGRKVPVVLDPVFLPEMSRWEELAGKRRVEGEYLFAYFLGDDREQRKTAFDLAERSGMKLVTIPYLTGEYRSCDREFGQIRACGGPEEFLDLIRHASWVVTDSFHAAAFSFLFHTPLTVFRRGKRNGRRNMDSRLEHLAEMFGTPEIITEPAGIFCPDFARTDRILERERARSRRYLEQILAGADPGETAGSGGTDQTGPGACGRGTQGGLREKMERTRQGEERQIQA